MKSYKLQRILDKSNRELYRRFFPQSQNTDWENTQVDIVLEFGESISDWFDTEFRKRYNLRKNGILKIHLLSNNEEILYGYVECSRCYTPFIACYISTDDSGHKYRIYFYNNIEHKNFQKDAFEFERYILKD